VIAGLTPGGDVPVPGSRVDEGGAAGLGGGGGVARDLKGWRTYAHRLCVDGSMRRRAPRAAASLPRSAFQHGERLHDPPDAHLLDGQAEPGSTVVQSDDSRAAGGVLSLCRGSGKRNVAAFAVSCGPPGGLSLILVAALNHSAPSTPGARLVP
jgi:hypothetical protein